MKFAVYGCQHFHIQAFIDEMCALGHEFAGIYDRSDYGLPRRLAAMYDVPLYYSAEQLQSCQVELIGTAARNDDKINVIEWAERHGIHVMTDKPAVIDRDGLERLKRVTERGVIKVGMLLTARFSPAQVTLKHLINTGELGELRDFTFLKPHKLMRDDRPGWFFHKRFSGGLIIDLMVHDADMLHWFTGKEVVACDGVLMCNEQAADADFYDNAMMNVRLEQGITATLKADWLMPEAFEAWGDGRIFATGSKGRAEIRTSGDVLGERGPFVALTTQDAPTRKMDIIRPQSGVAEDFVRRLQNKPHEVTAQDIVRCSETVLRWDAACLNIEARKAGAER